MKNKKHIAMRCNKEQFEAIKPKLKANIKFNSVTDFKKYNYLVNCDSNMISNICKTEPFIHVWKNVEEIHEEWNEKIFLEACGIETIPTLEEVKEYFKDAETIQDHSGDVGFPESNKFEFTPLGTGVTQNVDKKNWLVLWHEKKGYAKILTYKTPKFEITKEQILELYNTGNPQPTIRKMFPEVFEKFNGWASDSLRINKNWLGYYENSILKYGVDSEGQWFVSESKSKFEECKTNIKATPEEVTEALKKEALKRYKVGDKIKCLHNQPYNKIDLFQIEVQEGLDCVRVRNKDGYLCCVFEEGIWAEIIEQSKWVRPFFNANAIFWKKWQLEHAMKSWADFHNKLDGFVPDWSDTDQEKWGFVLCKNKIKTDYYFDYNYFIFQISVSSRQRAKEMYKEFKDELDDIKW